MIFLSAIKIFHYLCGDSWSLVLYLASWTCSQSQIAKTLTPTGWEYEGRYILKGVTWRFVLDVQESGSSTISSQPTKQQWRPWVCNILLYTYFIYRYCISAWASALLVSTTKQCQSFWTWDRQQVWFSRFFFVYAVNKNVCSVRRVAEMYEETIY